MLFRTSNVAIIQGQCLFEGCVYLKIGHNKEIFLLMKGKFLSVRKFYSY